MTFEKEHDDLKYILDKEQEINKFLTKLVEVITADEKKKIHPCGSAPGILYGNCKIHKKMLENSYQIKLINQIQLPIHKM